MPDEEEVPAEDVFVCVQCGQECPCSELSIEIEPDTCVVCRDELYASCYECSQYVHRDYAICQDYEYFCERCFDRYYVYCYPCGEYHHDSQGTCEDDSDGDTGQSFHGFPIYEYHVRPPVNTKRVSSDSRNEPICGFELELEIHKHIQDIEAAKCLDDLDDLLYFKQDGSLFRGVEIVSHPMTFGAFKEYAPKFKPLLKRFRELGYSSCLPDGRETCGMHVHMSRRHFSPLDKYKLLTLVHSDLDALLLFSGRVNADRFNQYASPTLDGHVFTEIVEYADRHGGSTYHLPNSKEWNKARQRFLARTCRQFSEIGKYTAINTLPTNTIEFRFFASTTDWTRFVANMQSVWAMRAFVKRNSLSDMTWNRFNEYAIDHKSRYPELASLITHLFPITTSLQLEV